MSLEKAILFEKYPILILKYIEEENNCKIYVEKMYFNRDNMNLKMNSVIFTVEYKLINKPDSEQDGFVGL